MHTTPRINYDGTLVVPPFECCWLGSGNAFKQGSGCVCFEVGDEARGGAMLPAICVASDQFWGAASVTYFAFPCAGKGRQRRYHHSEASARH